MTEEKNKSYGSPPIRSILQRDLPEDLEYKMGLLTGPQGVWHRLWATMSMEAAGHADSSLIEQLHTELAKLIGRQLLPSEFEALKADATTHAKQVLIPRFGQNLSDNL